MAAITNYTTLAAAIDSWDVRTHDSDEIIGLAEAEFRLYFGPSFAKETASLTLAFTLGSAAQPSGFIRPLALTNSTYGTINQKDIGTIRARRIAGSGTPTGFAVTGSTIEVDGSFAGTMILDYEGSLVGLSASNLTNWLITNAPQAYLAMCMSIAKAKFEDFTNAPLYKSQAMQTLYDLGIQSMVAQQGRASVTIPGSTP